MDLKSLENPSYYKRTLNLWAPPHQPACLGTDFLASSIFPNGLLASKCFRTIESYNNFKAAVTVSGLQGPPCQGLGSYCSSQSRERSTDIAHQHMFMCSYFNGIFGEAISVPTHLLQCDPGNSSLIKCLLLFPLSRWNDDWHIAQMEVHISPCTIAMNVK